VFEYHVPLDGPFDPVTGPLRKFFHRPTVASRTFVCLDHDGKVASTHVRQSN
jgi:hypothetical protein